MKLTEVGREVARLRGCEVAEPRDLETSQPRDQKPGTILSLDAHGVVIATADDSIRIVEMQRPGKPRAAAADVARGLGWRAGERLE